MTSSDSTCPHAAYRVAGPRPFTGPVSLDEVRAAHGGTRWEHECSRCGARRSANLNGLHGELGPWAGSTAQRRDTARAAAAAARRAVEACRPLRVVRADGLALTMRVGADGMVAVAGDPHRDEDSAAALRSQPEWLSAAVRARELALRAQALTADVGEAARG